MKSVLAYIGLALFFLINYLPLVLGVGYMTTMLVAGCVAVYASPAWAWTILQYGWKSYLVTTGITFMVMTTFTYQHCCIGMQGFRSHMRHAGKRHLENLLVATLWPYEWFVVDQNLRSWGMDYLGIVLNAIHYWFVEIWKGVRLESWTLRNGEVEKVDVTHAPSDGR